MRFARWVFTIAGIYGVLVLVPQLFMEQSLGTRYPPSINHTEFFYGFLGVGLAWQIAFLVIGRDPQRLRPLMLPAIVEKIAGLATFFGLALVGRTPPEVGAAGLVDGLFAALFAMAFVRTAARNIDSHKSG